MSGSPDVPPQGFSHDVLRFWVTSLKLRGNLGLANKIKRLETNLEHNMPDITFDLCYNDLVTSSSDGYRILKI